MLSTEQINQLKDRKWRLNHLYSIVDKHGQIIKFTLNPAQERLLDNLHYLNVILKARQLGFSLSDIQSLILEQKQTPLQERWQALTRRKLSEVQSFIEQAEQMQCPCELG